MIKQNETAADRGLLPEGSSPARVIVCERQGKWAVALRRELAAESVCLSETRTLSDSWELLRQSPASFLVLELTPTNVDPLLAGMLALQSDFPLARAAVVADRRLAAYEWLAREAGAVGFLTSPRELAPFAQAIVRHLRQAPKPRLSLVEQFWAELPWGHQR